jgi:diketogulonate reductase-like aldo/keto reductase
LTTKLANADQGAATARPAFEASLLAGHLNELLVHASVPPAMNQIELSPFLYRTREDTPPRR